MLQLGMGLQMRQSVVLTQEMKLTMRMGFQIKIEGLRLELSNLLKDNTYDPEAICPRCNMRLTSDQILSLFSRDPKIYTINCPSCNEEFQPLLMNRGTISRMGVPYYCPAQTLDKLNGKQDLTPDVLLKEHAAVYRSVIKHFKDLKSAFQKNGVKYPYETPGWKELISPFLGRLPDRQIALCIDKSPHTIRRLRDKLGVERFKMYE